jgi:hypothetical protein
MSQSIKKLFKMSELQVGDIIYDTEKETMVKVSMIGPRIKTPLGVKVEYKEKYLDMSKYNVYTRQYVLEDTDTQMLFLFSVITHDMEPEKESTRFRHLIREQHNYSPIITYPNCPPY